VKYICGFLRQKTPRRTAENSEMGCELLERRPRGLPSSPKTHAVRLYETPCASVFAALRRDRFAWALITLATGVGAEQNFKIINRVGSRAVHPLIRGNEGKWECVKGAKKRPTLKFNTQHPHKKSAKFLV